MKYDLKLPLLSVLNKLVLCLALMLISSPQRSYAADFPCFKDRRFNEDWTLISDCPDCYSYYDTIKHLPYADGCYASFGGQFRTRLERWNNFNFSDANDDSYALVRTRLHADLHFWECARIFVEGKSAVSTDRDLPGGRRTLDVDTAALQNAFVDLIIPEYYCTKVTVRLGRQEMFFGRHRLISTLDWSNTRHTYDGVSVIANYQDWNVTGFYTHHVKVDKYDFNESSNDDRLSGLYVTGKLIDCITLDLYWLLRNRNSATYNGLTFAEDRHSLGARVGGKVPDTLFDFELEATHQFGDFGSQDIDAYMVAAQAGYTFIGYCSKLRFFAGFDYATGDKNSGDTKMETFSHILPLAHAYLGFIDAIGRQNILAYHGGWMFSPFSELKVLGFFHDFRRASSGDALYNAGAGTSRAAGVSTSKDVGHEIDLLVKLQLNRHLILLAGYSHFFPGQFIEETTPTMSDPIDFGYASIQFTF